MGVQGGSTTRTQEEIKFQVCTLFFKWVFLYPHMGRLNDIIVSIRVPKNENPFAKHNADTFVLV